MKSIQSTSYSIHFNETCYEKLNTYLKGTNFSKIFLLVDTNTHIHCLPRFLSNIDVNMSLEIIEMEAGEIHKTLDTCTQIWHSLSDLDGDRQSLIINLGGGVVTDLGGFVASTFKRGVCFVNVPTTLLSMVDASVGGKTGVDLGVIKNQIGVINFSDMVLIDPLFLETLPEEEIRSGFAEMLKHGLIKDADYWNRLCSLKELNISDLGNLIHESVTLKNEVVKRDPTEQGERKQLNFGHTLGHAIESYRLENETLQTLLHGEAIAIGMVMEGYLSAKTCGLSEEALTKIKKTFKAIYGSVDFTENDKSSIIELLKYDKKNSHGQVKYALLESIGSCVVDIIVDDRLIDEAFLYYAS
ncbi:3-dehydroquinate synthase [Flavobacteriaceae bacterium]|jgi:3-dehydroquinate synthase|nr:3-dehydroquinate synthase [Flavobacteriaceae bacterium]